MIWLLDNPIFCVYMIIYFTYEVYTAVFPIKKDWDFVQVKRAHNAIKHLADYVLVWGGGQQLGVF